MIEYDEKREVIRLHDNSNFGKPDWYGRKDYAHLSITQVEERFMEVMIEKARNENGQG